jgi:hypothetical protein
VSWSWAFWIGAIFAGATWPLFYFFDETYGPTILKRRARRLRKETGDESIIAPLELEKTDLNHIVTVILTRPLRMICFEPLVLFTCLYLSYACKCHPYPPNKASILTSQLPRRHFLHLPPILHHHLHWNLSFQRRRNGPNLPPHRRRRPHLRWHLPLLGLVLGACATSESLLVKERRDASVAACLYCRPFFRHQRVLARLDE